VQIGAIGCYDEENASMPLYGPADYPFWFRLVVVITLALFAVNAFFFIGPVTASISVVADPAFVHKWQSLIGVLASGTVTLIAATIAWRAVQRQIANQRAIASRSEDDAFVAIQNDASDIYGTLNLAWRAVDVALSTQWPHLRGPNFGLVRVLRQHLPDEQRVEALVEMAQKLGQVKRRQFLLFVNMLRMLCRHYRELDERAQRDNLDADELASQRRFYVLTLRTYLTHAWTYLKEFDPESAMMFAERTKSPVDHRPMHEHMEGSIARAEAGENWLH
jgi:hypothetical protein